VLFQGVVEPEGSLLATGQAREGHLTFMTVLTQLMEGAMDGELDRIMNLQAEAHASSFTWLMMAVFGITVVLLLLNLLIARFSKTFDMIYENVDANFKVAFARVVLKGAGQELVPPPFNLIRLAVLMVYSFLNLAAGWCCEGAYDRLSQLAGFGRARLLNCINANTRTSAAGGSPMQLQRRGSSYYSEVDSENAENDEEEMELMDEFSITLFESRKITQFIRKASSLEVQLYPAAVEEWVARHQHDISRDERWRTNIAQQIADLDSNIRRVLTSQKELTTDNETDGKMARRYTGVRGAFVTGRNSEAMNAPVSSFGSSSSRNGGAVDNVSVAHLQVDMTRLLARMASQETLLQQLTSPGNSKGTPGTSKGKPRWTDA